MADQPYTVRNITSFRGREGYGFNATLYAGDRRVAVVYDDASGGMYRYEWLAKDRAQQALDAAAFTAAAKAQPPIDLGPEVVNGAGVLIDCDPDTYMARLVDEAETAKKVRALLKRRVLLLDGTILRQSANPPSPAVLAALAAKYPQATILNALPEAEAVARAVAAMGAAV